MMRHWGEQGIISPPGRHLEKPAHVDKGVGLHLGVGRAARE